MFDSSLRVEGAIFFIIVNTRNLNLLHLFDKLLDFSAFFPIKFLLLECHKGIPIAEPIGLSTRNTQGQIPLNLSIIVLILLGEALVSRDHLVEIVIAIALYFVGINKAKVDLVIQ